MDGRALHEKAKTVKPDQELAERRYWVAILYHHLKPESAYSQGDFLWIKTNAKTTVETIHNEYYKKTLIETVLKLGEGIPCKTTKLPELNLYNDQIIAFRAIEASSPEARPRVREEDVSALNEPVRTLGAQNAATIPVLSTEGFFQPPASLSSRYVPSPYMDPATHSSRRLPRTTPDRPETPTSSSLPPGEVRSSKLPLYETKSVQAPDTYDSQNLATEQSQTPQSDENYYGSAMSSFAEKLAAFADLHEPSIKSELNLPSAGDAFDLADSVDYKDDQHMADNSLPTEDVPNAEAVRLQNVHLQKLMTATSPELLEAGAGKGVELLEALKLPMTEYANDSQDASQWLEQTIDLQKQAGRTRTVVGVVGNTGAGKSSVINAMLDEERLVPTNCMRACTAVVTELSWNDSDNERERYRAEIEFIKPEDWEKELRTLFDDLLDSNGEISRECTNKDSDAGVAYAKIKAVYPHKTKDMLVDSSVDALLKEKAVRQVLGTMQTISEARPESFYKRLQEYVDSKEKVTSAEKDKDNDKKKEKKQMEFWPLIKVVKIYTKSDALSTGAVIVDLPGVHDNNAARAAVAQNYTKQCTGLWIVAPITRAVDDKAAKTLLGESFKRQLKYDGTYSSVTFICSKTDDISITEAADTLNLETDIHDWQEELDQIDRDRKRLKKQVGDLDETKKVYDSVVDESDELQETWELLKGKVESGHMVYAPRERSEKRKRSSTNSKSRKRRLEFSQSDSDVDLESSQPVALSSDDSDPEDEQPRGDPLTEEQCDEKLAEIKAQKKQARIERSEIVEKIRTVKKEIAALNQRRSDLKSMMGAVCIAGRNKHSKGAIQQDFAAGIEELDQENAADEDEENFNPDEDLRDYDEVARSLPVFCISSRAYQKLCGRLPKDAMPPGFKDVQETEMPQLQAHCKKLTEASRASGCRKFLNSLSQLLNSLSLWAANKGVGAKLTDDQREAEASFLQTRLKHLEAGLDKTVSDCLYGMKENLAGNIYDKFAHAIAHAEAEAGPTSQRWGAHRDAGGLYWATYKAVCRRDGAFTNIRGLHDFNAQLTEPLSKDLVSGWEKAFQRRMPQVLQSYTKNSGAQLRSFHQAVEARAMANGTGVAGLHMLAHQLTTYEQTFADLGTQMVNQIMSLQKDANREFTPQILEMMRPANRVCTNESGTGSYARMKRHMTSHVEGNRHTMFATATEHVKNLLTQMCRAVEEHMSNSADRIFVRMRADYMQVMGGVQMPAGYTMPTRERTLKSDVAKLIGEAEDVFRKVVEPEDRNPAEDADNGVGADAMDGIEDDHAQQNGNLTGGDRNEEDVTIEDAGQHDINSTDADQRSTPELLSPSKNDAVDSPTLHDKSTPVDESAMDVDRTTTEQTDEAATPRPNGIHSPTDDGSADSHDMPLTAPNDDGDNDPDNQDNSPPYDGGAHCSSPRDS